MRGRRLRVGRQLVAGLRTDQVLQRLECELRPVDPAWHDVLLRTLEVHDEDATFTVLQCMWPDEQGKMPHGEGFDEMFRPRQPHLEHADAERAGMTQLMKALGKG